MYCPFRLVKDHALADMAVMTERPHHKITGNGRPLSDMQVAKENSRLTWSHLLCRPFDIAHRQMGGKGDLMHLLPDCTAL